MTTAMRIAIYIRVSTSEQALSGYSLAAQEKTLLDFCTAQGWEVVEIYRDEGISAKDLAHRPAMLRLITDAKLKKFDKILIWKLTRLTRSVRDLCAICETLLTYKVSLQSVSESFDFGTPMGRMVLYILGVIAQWEREVIAENVKLASLERVAQGKHICSHILGYRHRDGSLVIRPEEAERVRTIFEQYLRVKDCVALSSWCRNKGIRTVGGFDMIPGAVDKILRNAVYAGWCYHSGQVFPGEHEAIVGVDTYNRVQKLLYKESRISKIFVLGR